MSEHEEEDSDEMDGYEHRSGRAGRSAYEGASGGGGTGTGRRHDRERSSSGRRDHSASRERSVSPRSERRSQASSAPTRPAKVTLVKSRKNEGGGWGTRKKGKGSGGNRLWYLNDNAVLFCFSLPKAEYGLRLASHIFVKDISPESLAARDGNIQEGDVVLKVREHERCEQHRH